jgi:hypothetical protein
MRGWMLSLLLAVVAIEASRAGAAAAERAPRRYERGSYSQYIVRKRQGQPVVSQVYNGYAQRYQPPAFLYYGYPHSGDGSGIGPMDRK